jgi:hypothetical protein
MPLVCNNPPVASIREPQFVRRAALGKREEIKKVKTNFHLLSLKFLYISPIKFKNSFLFLI